MLPINYHHLYYFHTIAQKGSVSEAARELRVSQPALSAQLKQFENYLEVKLFSREGKKMILTESGRHVLTYAAEIVNLGKELIDGIKDLSGQGQVRIQIGITSFIPKSFVDAVLQFIVSAEPNVYIALEEDSIEALMNGLKTHLLDFILTDVAVHATEDNLIENRIIGKAEVVFCVHKSLYRKYKDTPESLHGAPMILPTSQSQIYQSVQQYFITHKIQPKVIGEIKDVELVRRLVMAKMGIAPLNQFTVMHAPGKEELAILNPKSKNQIFDLVYLITKKRLKPHPVIEKLIQNTKNFIRT